MLYWIKKIIKAKTNKWIGVHETHFKTLLKVVTTREKITHPDCFSAEYWRPDGSSL
jgi:hypothetical protein